jgi:hypothetical protein
MQPSYAKFRHEDALDDFKRFIEEHRDFVLL